MQPTSDPHINKLIAELFDGIRAVFGDDLVAVYLHGSLVVGDFDAQNSDIDMLVVLKTDVDSDQFDALDRLHRRFLAAHPDWKERLDINYMSAHALQTFKTQPGKMARITPGDPFQMIEAGHDWLLSWYPIRQQSIILFGPPPAEIIAPISSQEFVASVKEHVQGWQDHVFDDDRWLPQAYLVLLLCRALYTCSTGGQQTSKFGAARWAEKHYPAYAATIRDAVKNRPPDIEAQSDYAVRLPATRAFYRFALAKLETF